MNETEQVVEIGGLCFSEADSANIPVNIFIGEIEDNYEQELSECKWELVADNFMPRKGVHASTFHAACPTKEPLIALLREHVLPLYQAASTRLNAMLNGTTNSLYYWDDENEDAEKSS